MKLKGQGEQLVVKKQDAIYATALDEIIDFRKSNGRIVSEKYVKFIIQKYFKMLLFVLLSTVLLAGFALADLLTGDLNSSGQVNVDDLDIFAGQWLSGPGCAGHPDDCADLVGDDGAPARRCCAPAGGM